MAFAPCLSSTPKFVQILDKPSHYILAEPIRIEVDKQLPKLESLSFHCRPLKVCPRRIRQSNVSTAINRQHGFDNDTSVHRRHIFCVPLNLLLLFHATRRRRRRHAPCHV